LKKAGLLLVLFIFYQMLLPLFDANANADGSVKLIPSTERVRYGQQFEVDVYLENVYDLYGLQIHLRYDSNELEVVDFWPAFFGWQESVDYYVISNLGDGQSGTFGIAFTCLGEERFFSGSGKVGTIVFKVKGKETKGLRISANTADFGERACMGVDSAIQTVTYQLSDVEVVNDNTPPGIKSIEVLSNNTVKIIFDEAVDPQSAQDLNNYSISPYLAVKDVQLDPSGTAVILITDSQVGNRTYQVTVSNIEDVIGNKIDGYLNSEFRGALKLWLEAESPIYKGNACIVRLKAGPVEKLTRLTFYVRYDESYFGYQALSRLNENFTGEVQTRTGSSGTVFGGTLMVSKTFNYVTYYDEWTICEFSFMPKAVTSINLEFVNYVAAPLKAHGIAEGTEKDIVVDFSNEEVHILQSYTLRGYIQLAGFKAFDGLQAFLVDNELIGIAVNLYDGSFELNDLKPGIYTIRLLKPGYLDMDYSVDVQSDTTERLSMIAGDLDSNGQIDILDIAAICKKFSLNSEKDGWDAVMDYNGDKWIDIIDVSIVARNYGKKSNIVN